MENTEAYTQNNEKKSYLCKPVIIINKITDELYELTQ